MEESVSYIRDTENFLKRARKKKKRSKIKDGAILVTAEVVGLYDSICHEPGLETLKERKGVKNVVRLTFLLRTWDGW